jgi:FlaA1/EpsC-like NDP-sugar epimerase
MSKQNKTILITGGCGFVGTQLVNHLLRENLFSKILVCCRRKKQTHQNSRLQYVQSDLLTPEKYGILFSTHQIDEVIHLAAIARYRQGEENPEETIKANFFGTIELIKLAARYGVKRFLYVSSNLARNPKGVTGVSKYLVEAFIKNFTPPPEIFSIRLPNVIDSPGAVTLVFKKQIQEGSAVTLTDKRMTRKFITPEQSAIDLLYVLQNGHHTDIYINNKPSTPIIKLAQQMIAESGKNIPVKFIGMRPGEKLEEEDYPAETVQPANGKDLFLLTEDQHKPENILQSIELLNGKVSLKTINKIKALFNVK